MEFNEKKNNNEMNNLCSESSDEDSNIIYIHIYECNKCGYSTRNDDPDCSKCGKKMCMYAREIKINCDEDEDKDEDDDNCQLNEPTICTKDCACDKHKTK